MTWPSLLAEEGKGVIVPQQQAPDAEASRSVTGSGLTSGSKADAVTGDAIGQEKKKKKNWDKIEDDDEEPDPSDPVCRPASLPAHLPSISICCRLTSPHSVDHIECGRRCCITKILRSNLRERRRRY